MATDSTSHKRLRVQRPGPLSSLPVQTFFSISPPKRLQHPSIHQAFSTKNRNQKGTRPPQDIEAIFAPEAEYDQYPRRYGMPRPSWKVRRACHPLAQALEQTQPMRHQIEAGLGVVATSKRGSNLSALLRRSFQQQQRHNDRNDDDEGYGDPSNSNNNNSTAIEMLHQEQEKRDFKRRSSSPFSIFRSPVPPHLLYKDDSDVAPQADRRNTRPANDDYEEYNNPDQDYNLSQDLPSAAPKDRRIWSHDSATAISIDYDDDDLMDLALDLELHLKLNNGQLDFDEMMRRPDFRTLYDDTNRANFREAVKAFLIISVSSTAAVYLLLLTYKLAEDLYIFVTFEVALTLLRWAWILVAVWPWHLMLWMGLGAYHLFLMVLWPSKDTLAMAFHMSVMYTLRRLRRTMMVKQP